MVPRRDLRPSSLWYLWETYVPTRCGTSERLTSLLAIVPLRDLLPSSLWYLWETYIPPRYGTSEKLTSLLAMVPLRDVRPSLQWYLTETYVLPCYGTSERLTSLLVMVPLRDFRPSSLWYLTETYSTPRLVMVPMRCTIGSSQVPYYLIWSYPVAMIQKYSVWSLLDLIIPSSYDTHLVYMLPQALRSARTIKDYHRNLTFSRCWQPFQGR